MRKILILFMVWMTFQLPVYAAETGTTAEMSARVYESMNEAGTVVANVIQGSVFTILSEHVDENGTEWYFICTDTGMKGYIQKEKTFQQAEETEQSEVQMQQGQIKFIQNVNIREQPTTDAVIVGRVPSNTILVPMQKQENETGEVWYQISYEGVTGYIRESTVDIIEIEQEEEEPLQQENVTQGETQSEQNEMVATQEIQKVSLQQEEQKDISQSTEKVEEVVREKKETAVCEQTTRKAVNPIDGVVLFLMLGMILSMLPVVYMIKKIRKKQRRKADYNRNKRR